jgi:Xaa-Pro aminopeptidase
MAVIRPGISAEEVNRLGGAPVDAAGFGPYWEHRLGYSIGLNYPPTGARAIS